MTNWLYLIVGKYNYETVNNTVTPRPFRTPFYSAIRIPKLLLQPVVRSFLGDHHVVNMRLAKTRARDPYELRPILQRFEAFAPAVAHACPHAADELEHARGKRPLVRYPSLDALGHELGPFLLMFLEVAVLAAPLHRADGTHAAINLVGAALV